MNQSKKKIIIAAVAIAVVAIIAFIIFGSISASSPQISDIVGTELISQSTSPDGRYTITSYLNDGDKNVSYAVLCSVTDNETNKERNIYWNNNCANANIQWIDNETAVINGVVIKMADGEFDYRTFE